MPTETMLSNRSFLPAWMIFLCLFIVRVSADISVCATKNTGTFSQSSQYQSNGLCINSCSGYAFAIVSYKDCYCSNYYPPSDTTEDLSTCEVDCPGYPSDKCAGNGAYGYILIGTASGTQSESSSTSSSSSSKSSSSSSAATKTTSSSSQKTSVVMVTSTSTATPTASNGETVTSLVVITKAESNTETTVVLLTTTMDDAGSSVQVVTSFITSVYTNGSQTVTEMSTEALATSSSATSFSTSLSTSLLSSSSSSSFSSSSSSSLASSTSSQQTSSAAAAAGSSSDSQKKSSSSFWDSPGKVGGTFASVGIIVLIIIGLILFFYIRHRYSQTHLVSAATPGGIIAPSVNNSSLMNTPMMEKSPRSRFLGGSSIVLRSESATAATLIPIPFGGDVDQRLDPGQMFYNNLGIDEASKKSISDENDYSRKFLRVANPDESDLGLRSLNSKESFVKE
ncbi:hypothetical protein DASC09_006990 [Saccharomycopsis crataegensis]|uniref:WSC domain-containing protein n=1 Tax=Saccharomycopsis crataegensis TaxID=43959 RepID=A0AAV5QG82_9ASCO|nr:hypothetical protein DASC09_006990 [Saccharomycopsis crataegensis]